MNVAIQQQRIQHIVDSYSLAGREPAAFKECLDAILNVYSYSMLEWALVDVLVQNWLRYPLPRGVAFLHQVERCLQTWTEAGMISSTLTPEQFELIAGVSAPASLDGKSRTLVSHQTPEQIPHNRP